MIGITINTNSSGLNVATGMELEQDLFRQSSPLITLEYSFIFAMNEFPETHTHLHNMKACHASHSQ